MTNRELLELAAKAAGIELIPIEVKNVTKRGDDQFIGYMTNPDQWQKGWFNPLTDDGDALRLAVKLKMFLDLEYCCAKSIDNPWFGGGEDNLAGVNHDEDDPYAATRRAIVRAAAEIGKEQP